VVTQPGGERQSLAGNPVAIELESTQSATRWLVGAAAAVLAVLLAGVRLSTLGQLGAEQPIRLAIAILACAVGLAAVGTILVLAARVLISPGWTLSRLAHLEVTGGWQDHWLRPVLEGQRGLLTPDDALRPARLYRRHRRLLVAWFQLHDRGATTLPDDLDTDRPTTQRSYAVANDEDMTRLRHRLDVTTLITERVVTAANLAQARRRYRRLVQALPFLGALPVVAIPVFAWATTVEPEPRVSAPTPVRVQFAAEPALLQRAGLPAGCAGREVDAIAVGGSLLQPIVVSTGDPWCVLHRVRITSALGTAVPLPPGR
jgi:hypothetical protein